MADKERNAGTAESDVTNADIWSDGQETASDRRIREFTVRELEKSKKSLPKDRYDALVRAVGDILRNHYVREEEVREIVRVKISEFKDEVVTDVPSCMRHKFAPMLVNGVKTAEFLMETASDGEKFEAFKKALSDDLDLRGGFLRYWAMQDNGSVAEKSNAKKIMAENGGAASVGAMNALHASIVDEEGLVINDETLGTQNGGAREVANDAVTEQLKTKLNFLKDTNWKFYERAGGKVSKDFSSILGGSSLSGFSNAEIADVFSFAYVHSNAQYPLKNESSRIPDAVSKIQARFSNDPAGLIKISEGWGGKHARTKPAIDTRLQVDASGSVKSEFIKTAKESFKIAAGNLVEWFVTKQLREDADKEKIAKVTAKIKDAVEKTPADSNSNYFAKVWGKIETILKEAGVKNVEAKDNLQFIRQMLGLSVASREFDAKSDPKNAKYGEAFKECETNEQVDKTEAELLKKNPSDAEAIRKSAQTARLRIANPAFGGFRFGAFGAKTLSNAAAETVFRHEGPITEATVKKNLARTMKAEESRDILERHLGSAKFPKPIEDMSAKELEAVRDGLRSKTDPTEDEKNTLALLEKHIADKADARREYVAIATKKTYEEIVALEKSGQNIDAIYEKARKEPLFSRSASREEPSSRQGGDVPAGSYFGGRRALDVGETRTVRFEGSEVPVSVTKTGDMANPYRISVNGKESFECDGGSLDAHLEMAKFLCDNGLEFLAPVTAEMVRRNSVREGDLATAKDGKFGERERKLILVGLANAFELEGFPKDGAASSRMEAHLKTFATERSTTLRELWTRKDLLDENGNFRNREEFLAKSK